MKRLELPIRRRDVKQSPSATREALNQLALDRPNRRTGPQPVADPIAGAERHQNKTLLIADQLP